MSLGDVYHRVSLTASKRFQGRVRERQTMSEFEGERHPVARQIHQER